jgi:hypothetical protein
MDELHPVNQRVVELMAFFGYQDNIHGFVTNVLKEERSDKYRNALKGKYVIKTEVLVDFTNKVVNQNGEPLSGHWLLTGQGTMFLGKKHTDETNNSEPTALLKDALAELREQLAFLRVQNTDLTKALLKGEVVKQG